MNDFPIVEVIGAICAGLGGMWAMFRSLQSSFLKHIETSDNRMVELLTTKNGHMERIAKDFNDTIREFQGTVSTMVEKIDAIDKRV